MIIYSHRGNVTGPNTAIDGENSLKSVRFVMELGFKVEVDVRIGEDNKMFYFGHDSPDHLISTDTIDKCKANLLFHCKEPSAAMYLCWREGYEIFCHDEENYVMTSRGKIIVHPKYITKFRDTLPSEIKSISNTIAVLPEMYGLNYEDIKTFSAIITDHPLKYLKESIL